MTELALETTCHQVKQLLDAGSDFVLLDCRETEEHEIGTIAGAELLPMSELEARHEELADKQSKQVVVYCHHGMRSAQVAAWLRQHGFAQAQSMVGGIDRWSQEIDASVPRY